MKTIWLSIFLLSLTFTAAGCGGGEVDEEASEEMEQLQDDPDYERQMEEANQAN